jgi:chromosome segregation ATPase
MANIMISMDDDINLKRKALKGLGYNVSELCSMAISKEWQKVNPSTSIIDKLQKQVIDADARYTQLKGELEILEKELNSLKDQLKQEQSQAETQQIQAKEQEEEKIKKEKTIELQKNSERIVKLEKYIRIARENYEKDQDPEWLKQIEKHESELKILKIS